eukprot:241324-Pyramimonas_sp.AAC.1
MATSFIRVFALWAFDNIYVDRGAVFDAYIDDTGLSHAGMVPEVVEALVTSSVNLRKAVAKELGCALALDKVGCVCSHEAIADQLRT